MGFDLQFLDDIRRNSTSRGMAFERSLQDPHEILDRIMLEEPAWGMAGKGLNPSMHFGKSPVVWHDIGQSHANRFQQKSTFRFSVNRGNAEKVQGP